MIAMTPGARPGKNPVRAENSDLFTRLNSEAARRPIGATRGRRRPPFHNSCPTAMFRRGMGIGRAGDRADNARIAPRTGREGSEDPGPGKEHAMAGKRYGNRGTTSGGGGSGGNAAKKKLGTKGTKP